MNKPITFSVPFSKVDEEQRIVTGIATAEMLDKQGEIVDYEASKKAFSDWKGNIREMHESKAVGKTIDIQYDDANKAVIISAKISESADGQNAWTKIKEGVLTGFSIGGSVQKTAKEAYKADDGTESSAVRIQQYTLSETSLVDSPACPAAEFLMVKRDGDKLEEVEKMVEHAKPVPVLGWQKAFTYSIAQYMEKQNASEEVEIKEMSKKDYSDKDRADMADKGQALPDGSFPVATVADLKNAIQAIGRAKDPDKAKAHIKARAKALGRTDLIPDTWKADKPEMTKEDDVKEETTDVEPSEPSSDESKEDQGEEATSPQDDAEGEETDVEPAEAPETEEVVPETTPEVEPAEEAVETPEADAEEVEAAVETPETPEVTPEAPEAPVDEEKADKSETLRKDLYSVASFADAVNSIACIRDWLVMEADVEGDDSPIPGRLTNALDNLTGILTDMAQEEAAEAAATPNAALAASDTGDMQKTLETMMNGMMEQVVGKVETLVKPLADRLETLEHQPSVSNRPVATYHEVDRGVGNPAPALAGAQVHKAELQKRWDELKATADAKKHLSTAEFPLSARHALVDEMWKVNKQLHGNTTAELDPAALA